MEMLKGVLITFDVILMMIFFGIAVYSIRQPQLCVGSLEL